MGLDAVSRDVNAERAFIALGDQPRIAAEVPPRLLREMEESGRPAVVPRYRYQRGNPVLTDRWLLTQRQDLEAELDKGLSDERVEKIAREDYHMKKPGETVHPVEKAD